MREKKIWHSLGSAASIKGSLPPPSVVPDNVPFFFFPFGVDVLHRIISIGFVSF